jgi:hypothetical protein
MGTPDGPGVRHPRSGLAQVCGATSTFSENRGPADRAGAPAGVVTASGPLHVPTVPRHSERCRNVAGRLKLAGPRFPGALVTEPRADEGLMRPATPSYGDRGGSGARSSAEADVCSISGMRVRSRRALGSVTTTEPNATSHHDDADTNRPSLVIRRYAVTKLVEVVVNDPPATLAVVSERSADVCGVRVGEPVEAL